MKKYRSFHRLRGSIYQFTLRKKCPNAGKYGTKQFRIRTLFMSLRELIPIQNVKANSFGKFLVSCFVYFQKVQQIFDNGTLFRKDKKMKKSCNDISRNLLSDGCTKNLKRGSIKFYLSLEISVQSLQSVNKEYFTYLLSKLVLNCVVFRTLKVILHLHLLYLQIKQQSYRER